VHIRPVEGPAELRRFIDLPYRLHAGEPSWVAPLRLDMQRRLAPRTNPFFDHGSAAYFLAEREGTTIGRIAAVTNRLHDETHDDGAGFFGFFECERDPQAARALFDAAAEWVRGHGYRVLRGPASFSTNDECGLLVKGFDTPPTLLTTWNPPYYVELVEGAGFRPAQDLLGFWGGHADHPVPPTPRLDRAVGRIAERLGVTLRALDSRRFWNEVETVRALYNRSWERNWGFVPMTDRELSHMARELRPIHIADIVPFAEHAGEPIGFGLALPDLNEVLRGNRKGRLLPGLLRILWALKRKRFHRMRILLLGVRPDFRGRGVDALLWHWIWTRSARYGLGWGEASWILADNAGMRNAAERSGLEAYKTWRLYDRPA
jgi:GNAT superfamily N-acetyltransferase